MIFSRMQIAMYCLGELVIEGSNGREGHLYEAMLPRSFHQLSNPVCVIKIHDDVQACSTGNANSLAELGEAFKNMIGFDDDSRDSGTHWRPQQLGDFRREMIRAAFFARH